MKYRTNMLLFILLWVFPVFGEDFVRAPLEVIYHPVTTTSGEAQGKFNRGLTYIFAFNHDLAFQNFEEASRLDPELAMAYWGMGLALGQNMNSDVTPENEVRAYGFAKKALELMGKASASEQAYINALQARYVNDPKADFVPLRFTYRDAMKKVMESYPQDLDAASLYAESILNLDPWKYWTWDGKPKEGTEEAIGVLQSVLIRNPFHLGANHYYIHAWEESPTPEMALMSAFRLTKLFKEGGHLLHMPCHIFILTGYYKDAIETSHNAIAADRLYIKEHGMGGEYPLHYLTHNIKILARLYMLSEDYDNAMKTAGQLLEFVSPHYGHSGHLSNAVTTPIDINLYFHKWQEVLNLPAPPETNAYANSYWHFARALASINLGDLDAYLKERQLMLDWERKIPPGEEIANNPAPNIINLASTVLDAALAKHENNPQKQIELLKTAVDKQDHLYYDEPPAWYTLLRNDLGEAYFEQKQYKEAEAAFQKALLELQRNPRLLSNLAKTLKAQDRHSDALWVEREANAALSQ